MSERFSPEQLNSMGTEFSENAENKTHAPEEPALSRRKFLKQSGLAVAGLGAGLLVSPEAHAAVVPENGYSLGEEQAPDHVVDEKEQAEIAEDKRWLDILHTEITQNWPKIQDEIQLQQLLNAFFTERTRSLAYQYLGAVAVGAELEPPRERHALVIGGAFVGAALGKRLSKGDTDHQAYEPQDTAVKKAQEHVGVTAGSIVGGATGKAFSHLETAVKAGGELWRVNRKISQRLRALSERVARVYMRTRKGKDYHTRVLNEDTAAELATLRVARQIPSADVLLHRIAFVEVMHELQQYGQAR